MCPDGCGDAGLCGPLVQETTSTPGVPLYHHRRHPRRDHLVLFLGLRLGPDGHPGPVPSPESQGRGLRAGDLLGSIHRLVRAFGSGVNDSRAHDDRFITTPLLLLSLLLTAALPWPTILFTLLVNQVMIVCGLVGALTRTSFKVCLHPCHHRRP